MPKALIYGATGYTGRLIARTARDYDIRPVLAARSRDVATLSRELGFESRTFSLDEAKTIDAALWDASVVLHCAGPFAHTSKAMADACIRCGVHYVDITGEIEVFEALHARDAEARAADVMLLPGAGFDVVPSDCLAARLKLELPDATRLQLAIQGSGRLSRGTATTMIEHQDRGGMVRRNGKLTRVPAAWKTRTVDFGNGPVRVVTIPWGDVATAYYSTGIPNIEVYAAAPVVVRQAMRLSRYARWVLRSSWVKRTLQRRVRSGPAGPSERELREGASAVWGRVEDADGKSAEAVLHGPNGYLLTAHAALAIVQHVLAGQVSPGYQTAALAYGPELIQKIPGVTLRVL